MHPNPSSATAARAVADANLSRRGFVAASVAGGLAAATPAARAALPLAESDVSIKTADGTCDAAFIRPASGTYPGVLVWVDAFGLRPSMRDIARRLAGEGYAVLVPNPYYRASKAPQWESAENVDFNDAAFRAKLQPLRDTIQAPGAIERDAAAYVGFLDAQAQVDKARRMGSQGYCMGGALVVKTAAAVPERIGAGASLHGGGLVTNQPDSPHLLAPRIRARMYFGVARNDDQRQPDAKDKLREAFAAAKVSTEVEVYPAKHGWCVPDMPKEGGAPIYDAAQAERAWGKLLALYKAGLA